MPQPKTGAARLRLGARFLCLGLLLALHRRQALPKQVQQMPGIILGFRNRAALETGFRRAGLPVSGGDGDEFHHVKRDVLVAAHDYVTGPVFLHKALASLYAGFERRRARIIAESGASYLEPDVA